MTGIPSGEMEVSRAPARGMWLTCALCVLALGCGGSQVDANEGARAAAGAAVVADDGDRDDRERAAPATADEGADEATPGPADAPVVADEGDGEAAPGDVGAGAGELVESADAEEVNVAAETPVSTGLDTSESRQKMSAFLEGPAKAAMEKREYARAIALLQGLVAARGADSPEAVELARAWTLAGQSTQAIAVLDAYIAHSRDPRQLTWARAERARLAKAPNPFARSFEVIPAEAEAREAFKRGRQAFQRKRYGDAAVYFEMGARLAPDLPGFLRELGATYDRLGEQEKKLEFYRAYLATRPFGSNADDIRRQLRGTKGALAELTIQSSLPCDEVWLNRQRVPGKLPIKKLLVAPGNYVGLCINYKFEIAHFEYASPRLDTPATMAFRWAIVVNALEPWGRIRMENPFARGRMRDLGITSPEIGVVVPEDGRALRFELVAGDGSRQAERYIRLEPGKREVIKW
jgi:tetratricopeptide (TPR) repeat protein